MIDQGYMQVKGLKKEPFCGSHYGMRYYLRADEDKSTFTAFVYPEPWCFEDTSEEKKTSASFALSEEGMTQAVAWLLEQYEQNKEQWTIALETRMQLILAEPEK